MALCLLGFRGKGYSPAFVETMAAVQGRLRAEGASEVELVDAPDRICASCPNLAGGCTLGGPDHEAHMRDHDREVLRRLGLAVGTRIAWKDLLGRIAGTIRGSDLPAICTTCPWLELGVCATSVDALREPTP